MNITTHSLRAALAIAAMLVLMPFTAAQAGDFAVIGNAANSTTGDAAKSELKLLFLKKKTAWPSGESAVPLDRAAGSAEHAAFVAAVLGMGQADLDSHWQSEKQKTGETPPREVGSSSILFRQVARKPGAFGVITGAEAGSLPADVKVLFTFSN